MTSYKTASANGRRDAARGAILDHAVALFSARGLANVTVEDIAVAAGISVRSFYRYFSSREEVLVSFALRAAEFLPKGLARRPLDEPPLEGLLLAAAEWGASEEDGFSTWVSICRDLPPNLQFIQAAVDRGFRLMVAEALERRLPRDAVARGDAQIFAAVVVGVLSAVSERSLVTGEDRRPMMLAALDRLRLALTEPLG